MIISQAPFFFFFRKLHFKYNINLQNVKAVFVPRSPVMSGVPESAQASADSPDSGMPTSFQLSTTQAHPNLAILEDEPLSMGARGRVTRSLRGERDEDTPVPQIPHWCDGSHQWVWTSWVEEAPEIGAWPALIPPYKDSSVWLTRNIHGVDWRHSRSFFFF